MDKDIVMEAFRNCITDPKCRNCPWEQCNTIKNKKVEIPIDLALEVNNLLFDYMKEKVDKMTICECCELEHPADARKCPRCGTVAKTGHWTTKRTELHDGEWYCDQCDYEPTVFEGMPYCPSCGAKMEIGR